MKRLIATTALALTLAGAAAGQLTAELTTSTHADVALANGYTNTPKYPRPCVNNVVAAASAVAGAQRELTVAHQEARISESQLKTLSSDLKSATDSAEQSHNWTAVCSDVKAVPKEIDQR